MPGYDLPYALGASMFFLYIQATHAPFKAAICNKVETLCQLDILLLLFFFMVQRLNAEADSEMRHMKQVNDALFGMQLCLFAYILYVTVPLLQDKLMESHKEITAMVPKTVRKKIAHRLSEFKRPRLPTRLVKQISGNRHFKRSVAVVESKSAFVFRFLEKYFTTNQRQRRKEVQTIFQNPLCTADDLSVAERKKIVFPCSEIVSITEQEEEPYNGEDTADQHEQILERCRAVFETSNSAWRGADAKKSVPEQEAAQQEEINEESDRQTFEIENPKYASGKWNGWKVDD